MPDDARARLPREPYPGLRPFLDFEAALLFGRERQVKDVIARLQQTQFVAVLGGSGSGKSSLIHAGVVPELRSFGIPGAGDLWLPLTCTPGTNVVAADSASRRHSPVTRLARRFAALLKPRASDDDDAQRLQDIASVFRQEAGFARLLDTYGAELAVPPGPDPAEARVLFVLDQFEEIFHPTNKGVEDAGLLVERVLDHFFNPHPHCHVVLTMRSEHLNDCAAFLELPDAINKSSYLIRRLDDAELRDAILGPAQRYLRLMTRSENTGRTLPAEVVFDAPVLARLLRDVQAITHDPDHLPLLQHLLGRLWEAALEREEMDVPVPARITELDLLRAVAGGRAANPGEIPPLDERTNTLRACVENWPEAVYRWQPAPQQAQLDALFRRLAFKDPNTGLYSQQRIDVDAGALLLGPGKTRADLRALIAEGFLGSVDYLFWDDEDPARVTLKVSHESFIRGWPRFRRLIDRESEDFEEFLAVLRRCEDWSDSQRAEDFLLETGEMRRLRERQFDIRLARPTQRDAWFRWLLLDRDGPRLRRQAEQLDAFMATSSQRLRQRDRRQAQLRFSWVALGVAAVCLMLASTIFSVLVQAPVTQRAELLFEASNRANRTALDNLYPGIGAALAPLQSLLRAAELVDDARTGQGSLPARVSAWALAHLGWIPQVQRQESFLASVAANAEPPVNGKLRQLMGNAIWRGLPALPDDRPLTAPLALDITCAPGAGVSDAMEGLSGRLYVAAVRVAGGARQRAVLVPTRDPRDNGLVVRGASFDPATQRCVYGQIVISIAYFLDPTIVFDASLRYYYFTTGGPNVVVPAVTLQEIDWEQAEDDTSHLLQSQIRAVVTGPIAVSRVRQAAGSSRVGVVRTWRTLGGRTVEMGGQPWRLVTPAAQQLVAAPDDTRFVPLLASAAGSACAALARGVAQGAGIPAGFRNQTFEDASHCFVVTRGNAPPSAADEGVSDEAPQPAAGAAAPRREAVSVAVYGRPGADTLQRLSDNPPAAIATLEPFVRAAASDGDWRIGVTGDYAGWLALGGHSNDGTPRLVGAPWGACALWRLGQSLQPAAASAAAAASGPELAANASVCQER